MPYSSDQQRKWAHTDSAKKAGFPTDEFDKASKGKKLPEKAPKMDEGGVVPSDNDELYALTGQEDNSKPNELYALTGKKYADGGVVSYTPPVPAGQDDQDQLDSVTGHYKLDTQPDEFTQNLNNGMNADLDSVKAYLTKIFGNGIPGAGSNLQGLQNVANQQAGDSAVPQMAGGGITFPHREKSGPAVNTVPHENYDEGGVVPGQFDSSDATPDAGVPDPTKFNPLASHPASYQQAAPVQQPVQQPVQPIAPISDYVNQQKAAINQYGPEQQMALEKALQAQHSSGGQIAARALGTAGDALAQVGGHNANYAGQIAGDQNAQANSQREALARAGTQNVSNVKEQMALTAKDPNSSLSKSAQASFGPTLRQLGATPAQISQMPADLIADVANKSITLKDALARIEETGTFQQGMLGLKGKEAANTALNQSNARKDTAAKELQARPWYQKATELIPGLKSDATKEMQRQIGDSPEAPQGAVGLPAQVTHVTSQQEYDALPPGTHFVDSSGQRKIKGSK